MESDSGVASELAAAEGLLRRGRPLEAARLFQEAGESARAVDALVAAGRPEEAARLALDAGDPERALRLAARADLPELLSAAESALLLQQGRSGASVAGLLLGLGRPARAAELLAVGGDHKGAAALFEQVGRRERAAQELLSAGELNRAGELWTQHLENHPEDIESRLALARLLLQAGRERDAVAQAQAALRLQPGQAEAAGLAVAGLERLGLRHAAAEVRRRAPAADLLEAHPQQAAAESLGSIGRYELIELLGHGASATVYRARDRWSGQIVALKRMRADLEESPEALRRFLLEARLASRLRHPNIVAVLEADERGRFLTLELMDGGTLKRRMEGGPVPLAEVRRFLLEALAGLARAHFEGIVHRDLKPSNLLLDAAGALKLADFGVAHVLDSSWTRSGAVVGTYGYLAPEQLLGQPAQPATDLYALGVVLYELLCGRPPFTGRDLIRDHLDREVPWPERAGSPVTQGLGNALLRLLAKDPLDRPASALEAAELLSGVDWALQEAARLSPWPASEAPQADRSDTPGQESLAQEQERDVLLEEGRDALGTWRRLEDRWLGRRLMERRYQRADLAGPVLAALCEGSSGRLPILVRCDPAQGLACWIEPRLPGLGAFEPEAAAELRLLLEEVAAVLGAVPASLAQVSGRGWTSVQGVGRLPDGTCVLTSVDPLIPA